MKFGCEISELRLGKWHSHSKCISGAAGHWLHTKSWRRRLRVGRSKWLVSSPCGEVWERTIGEPHWELFWVSSWELKSWCRGGGEKPSQLSPPKSGHAETATWRGLLIEHRKRDLNVYDGNKVSRFTVRGTWLHSASYSKGMGCVFCFGCRFFTVFSTIFCYSCIVLYLLVAFGFSAFWLLRCLLAFG